MPSVGPEYERTMSVVGVGQWIGDAARPEFTAPNRESIKEPRTDLAGPAHPDII